MRSGTIGPLESPDRFELVRKLGSGSMGVVYEAIDRSLDATVALKTLHTRSARHLAELKREFRVVQGVLHPNLVRLGALYQSADTWFFTMEYLQGVGYLDWLRAAAAPADVSIAMGSSTIPPAGSVERVFQTSDVTAQSIVTVARLRESLEQLASGLVALHDSGLIHRDVKPSNILIADDGRLVLLDFGLVRPVADDDPIARTRAGTPAYMAPEQADHGAVSAAADCYAVGVMLYQALTGRLPFVGTLDDLLVQKRTWAPVEPRRLASNVPADLEALCLELLAPDPRERPTARDIFARVVPSAHSRPTNARTPRTSFVGRRIELAQIATAFERTASGRATVVVVGGESGIGKTTLVEEAARRYERERANALVLRGRCFEREVASYAGVDMLVDSLVGHLRERGERKSLALPMSARSLIHVFPTLTEVPGLATADSESLVATDHEARIRMATAFRELLGWVASNEKLVLVIDDAQWLTEESLVMLGSALAEREPVPLSLVLAARGFEAQRLGPWLERLTCDVTRIALGPLSREDSVDLLRQLGDADPERLTSIADDGAGHPYFLTELATPLEGDAVKGHARIDDVLRARASRLEPDRRELIELLCTAPRPVSRSVLAAATATTPADLAVSLRELGHRRWLAVSPERFGDTVQPAHDRIRSALRPEIEEGRVRHLQRRVAEAMETVHPDDVEGLAMQWNLAGDVLRAAHYAKPAAARAAEVLAFERATALYELALEGPADPVERSQLLAAQARALVGAGNASDAARCYLDAAALSDGALRDDLVLRAAEQLIRSGRVEEGKRVVSRVLEDLDIRVPVTSWSAVATIVRKRIALRIRGSRPRSLDAARRREVERRVDALWSVGDLLAIVDPLRASAVHSEGLLCALDLGEPFRLARLLCTDAMFLSMPAGRSRAAAEARLTWARELSTSSVVPDLEGYLALGAGVVRLHFGEFDEAQQALDQAERVFTRCQGTHWELTSVREFALWTLAYRGDLASLARRIDPALALARGRGDRLSEFKLLSGPSHLVMLARDQAELVYDVAERGARALAKDQYPFLHLCGLFARAQAAIYLGKASDALDDIEREDRRIRNAQLHRSQFFRVDLASLRGRAAIAALADGSSRDERTLRRIARLSIDQLRRERVAWATALARMLDTSVREQGDDERLAAQLGEVATELDRANLRGHADAVRWQRRRLVEDVATQTSWNEPTLVVRPERLAQTLAPLPR